MKQLLCADLAGTLSQVQVRQMIGMNTRTGEFFLHKYTILKMKTDLILTLTQIRVFIEDGEMLIMVGMHQLVKMLRCHTTSKIINFIKLRSQIVSNFFNIYCA